jgi:hypothetical protein
MSKEDIIFELKDVVRKYLIDSPQWEIIEVENSNKYMYIHIKNEDEIIYEGCSSFYFTDKESLEQAKIEAYKKLILAITLNK